MKIIKLKDFEGFDFAKIYAAIMASPEQHYEIHLHKFRLIPKNHYSDFQDWSSAAYIGQKFSNAADTFSYWVPSSVMDEPFIYQVRFTNPEELVDVLHYIVSHYINYYNLELGEKFDSAVIKFYNNIVDFKPDYTCKGLFDIAAQYLAKYVAGIKRAKRKERMEKIRRKYPFLKISN